jgi:hypothetical protein
MAWAVGPTSQSVMHARARSPATKMMNFRLGLYVVLPKSSAGAINFIWTTYLGNYHNCSTLFLAASAARPALMIAFLFLFSLLKSLKVFLCRAVARGRQDLLFFDLKSNQSLDLFFNDLRFKINLFKN